MDVKSMFPNLNKDEVAKVAAEEFMRSDVEVEVDATELGLYLAITYQGRREELQVLGLDVLRQLVQKTSRMSSSKWQKVQEKCG